MNSKISALQDQRALPVAYTGEVAPVSVVIPCYCCSNTIWRAVDSIVGQTLRPKELLFVDDASNDDEKTINYLVEIAATYGSLFKIVIIRLEVNCGAASARNRGWDAASQPYIAFLDADDAWHIQKIEIQYGWMRNHPEIGLTGHAHVQQKDSLANSWHLNGPTIVRPIAKALALLSNPFATPTVMLRRNLPERFKEGKRYIEDYLLWLQVILSGVPAAYIDLPLASTYKPDYGSGGLSAHLWNMEKGELDAYWQIYKGGKIGLLLVSFLFMYSLLKHVRRVLHIMIKAVA